MKVKFLNIILAFINQSIGVQNIIPVNDLIKFEIEKDINNLIFDILLMMKNKVIPKVFKLII
jgi:hypothetical protein